MTTMAELLFDITYLSGATSVEVLESLDDQDNFEVLHTLSELKTLILHRLMEEEDKS